MSMSQSTAQSSIVTGIIELGLGTAAVISGIVSMSKLTSPAAATIGIWALYFAIPGVLCIVAGYQKHISIMGVSLGMNIVGAILAVVALGIGATFWSILNDYCIFIFADKCACKVGSHDISIYSASCSDLKVVRNATGVATIVYALLVIISIVASILGCIGTCCAQREPQLVIADAAGQSSTIVVNTTQQAASFDQPSHPAIPQGFVQVPPPAYDNQYHHGIQYQQKQ